MNANLIMLILMVGFVMLVYGVMMLVSINYSLTQIMRDVRKIAQSMGQDDAKYRENGITGICLAGGLILVGTVLIAAIVFMGM